LEQEELELLRHAAELVDRAELRRLPEQQEISALVRFALEQEERP
jgi:hypothetical protein